MVKKQNHQWLPGAELQEKQGKMGKWHEETFQGDGESSHLDKRTRFTGVYIYQKA